MSWWKKFAKKVHGSNVDTPTTDDNAGYDHSDIQLRQGTAEFEEFVARAELGTRNNHAAWRPAPVEPAELRPWPGRAALAAAAV